MPEWTMRVINPTENFNIKTVTINVDKKGEREKIRVGLRIIADVPYTDNTLRHHCFEITRITDPRKRTGEIRHLGPALERIHLTPQMIGEIDFQIDCFAKSSPEVIAQYCVRCQRNIIPKNFGEIFACPICNKPYNLPE